MSTHAGAIVARIVAANDAHARTLADRVAERAEQVEPLEVPVVDALAEARARRLAAEAAADLDTARAASLARVRARLADHGPAA